MTSSLIVLSGLVCRLCITNDLLPCLVYKTTLEFSVSSKILLLYKSCIQPKNAQVATSLLTSWNRLVINKLISGCVRMACGKLLTTSLLQVIFQILLSASLLQVVLFEQTCCNLIKFTSLFQLIYNLLTRW